MGSSLSPCPRGGDREGAMHSSPIQLKQFFQCRLVYDELLVHSIYIFSSENWSHNDWYKRTCPDLICVFEEVQGPKSARILFL